MLYVILALLAVNILLTIRGNQMIEGVKRDVADVRKLVEPERAVTLGLKSTDPREQP